MDSFSEHSNRNLMPSSRLSIDPDAFLKLGIRKIKISTFPRRSQITHHTPVVPRCFYSHWLNIILHFHSPGFYKLKKEKRRTRTRRNFDSCCSKTTHTTKPNSSTKNLQNSTQPHHADSKINIPVLLSFFLSTDSRVTLLPEESSLLTFAVIFVSRCLFLLTYSHLTTTYAVRSVYHRQQLFFLTYPNKSITHGVR